VKKQMSMEERGEGKMDESHEMEVHFPEGNYDPPQIQAGAMKTDNGSKTFARHDSSNTRPFEGPRPDMTLEEWLDNKHPGAGRISKDMAKGVGGTRLGG
jgi:hypothetical protein